MPISGITSGNEEKFQNQLLRQSVQAMPTKTANLTSSTATGGAVTLNAGAGKITSDVLSLAGATEYVLIVTNSVITTTDLLFASLENLTNSVSPGPQVANATPGAGVMTIRIVNENVTAAVNGTVRIGFFVVKQETWPSPP